ncbi:class I SAM-dependent methyltransferase [Plantactinospora sp. CA-290183]|uniref:class I SAM-dependent methyltransferase n=1 Tax=Plantactinospora sp. CA-290183 TaxID=3240006 RepID=UPI003D89B680
MARTAVSHPVFARVFERASARMDDAGGTAHRRRLVRGLSGRIVEVGAGNGRNFAHYPAQVTEVLAVEPERRLRASGQRAADAAPVAVTVVDGVAEELPVEDGSVDAVVMSWVLCSVASQRTALAEAYRVLRPGGQLRFFEHVVAAHPGPLRWVQRAVDATIWPVLCGGCHASRDTVSAIHAAGFEISSLDRFRFPDSPLALVGPHVLGAAVRPVAEPAR